MRKIYDSFINRTAVNVKKTIFPARLSSVKDMDFFEYALNLPENSCVEVSVEDNKVHISKPRGDIASIELDTHVGFLHSCRIDDWPGYRTRADGRIERAAYSYMVREYPETYWEGEAYDDDVADEKGIFFDKCTIFGREDIETVMWEILYLDRFHEAHVLVSRLNRLKDTIGVPREPDIVSKGSQSIDTIKASDLLHLAMTTKEFGTTYIPIFLNPESMSIATTGLPTKRDKPIDLTTILERIEDEKKHNGSGMEYLLRRYGDLLKQPGSLLDKIDRIRHDLQQKKFLKELSYLKKFYLGHVRTCGIDDWDGFHMLEYDLVHHNGMKMTISQAYEEICKSNPDCDANQILKTIEQIRQSFNKDSA